MLTVLADTQEKPFGCRVCRRRYSRRDLLVRHERTLHTPEQVASAIKKRQSNASDELSPLKQTPSSPSAIGDGDNDEMVVLRKGSPVAAPTKPNVHTVASGHSLIETELPATGLHLTD